MAHKVFVYVNILLYHFFASVPPLFVIEFLHRVVDTFTEYFNSCTETSIKENVVIVFEVRMTFLSNKLHVSITIIITCLFVSLKKEEMIQFTIM